MHQALPLIMPINYVLTADAVLFRAEIDSALVRACRHSVVAFEIDDLAVDGRQRLSVHLVGFAERVNDQAAARALRGRITGLRGDGRDQVVAVTLGAVNGWVALPAQGRLQGTATSPQMRSPAPARRAVQVPRAARRQASRPRPG